MRSVSWSHFRWPLSLGCTVFVASSRPVVSGLGFEGGDKVARFAVYGLLGTCSAARGGPAGAPRCSRSPPPPCLARPTSGIKLIRARSVTLM
jgi:hypothetical protein